MKRIALLILLVLAPGGALRAGGDLLPAYYDVSGVAADDVLNLRAAPDAGAAIVGRLPPNRRNVEIIGLSEDGKWGLLAAGEGSAWVALRYLSRVPGQDERALPARLSCFGAEPFWALRLGPDSGAFDEPEGVETPMRRLWSGPAEGAPPLEFGLVLQGRGAGLQAVISRGLCSDGMSGRPHGFSIRAILSGDLGPRMVSGCCTLP